MQGIGYDQMNTTIQFATDFVGLGLPQAIWGQFFNLLTTIPEISPDLTCYATNGGICYLSNPCDSYTDAFYDYTIKINWDGQQVSYIPIGVFAVNDPDELQCALWIQYLAQD